jgi:uncharacterized protein
VLHRIPDVILLKAEKKHIFIELFRLADVITYRRATSRETTYESSRPASGGLGCCLPIQTEGRIAVNTDMKGMAQGLLVVLLNVNLCPVVSADSGDALQTSAPHPVQSLMQSQPHPLQSQARPMRSRLRAQAELPETVEKSPVVIWSDGTRMVGDVYRPAGLSKDEKLPAIIFCNGTGGTKDGTGSRLGPMFAQHGFIFLSFDYRGWGTSDSKLMLVDQMPALDANGEALARVKPIRWQMDFADQTYDIRSAISFFVGEPNVDPNRIGIMGSSYGGGLVTWVAANDPRVKCLVAQVPGMAAGRTAAALKASYALATKQARGETEPVPMETGKLTGKMEKFAQMRRNPAKGIGFSPIESADKISAPTLIVVAEKDELIDNDANGKAVYDIVKSKGSVPVAYHVIKDIGHFDVYNKGMPEAFALELKWYEEHLKDKAAG